MAAPLVSCVLATRDRHPFLRQAVRYFLRQTYEPRELIVVDDSAAPAGDAVPPHPAISYIRLDGARPLGYKLNLGIAQARGALIQKLDDDDYYHPRFLEATVDALRGRDADRAIAGFDSFLVLLAQTGRLTYSGRGWCAGGTLCFSRQLWARRPFRELPRAVDWWFLKDHGGAGVKIDSPELYILVRHGSGHLWNRLGKGDVSDYFARRPPYRRSLAQCIPAEDLAFYESLREGPGSSTASPGARRP